MNYFILALAIVAAIVALPYSTNIVRVAIGQVTWASNTAFAAHLVIAPTAIVLSIWLFGLAAS